MLRGMSNRKFRTNRSDYLFMLARGKVSNRYDKNNKLHNELLKDGLVKLKRISLGKMRWSDSQADKRNNVMYITDKGWEALLRRGRGYNNNVRIHRSLERLVSYTRGDNRKEMEGLLNSEDPRDLWEFRRLLLK